MMGYLNIKYCRRCKKAFDVDTDYDFCPGCRNRRNVLKGGEESGRMQ